MGQVHWNSGQTALWTRLQQLIEPLTGPSIWPVPTGFAVGAALLAAVSLSEPPVSHPTAFQPTVTEPSVAMELRPQPAAKSFTGLSEKALAGLTENTLPAEPRRSQTLLLPPRTKGDGLPRQGERTVARIEPVPAPPVETPVVKTRVAKPPPVKAAPPTVRPQVRRPKIAVVIDDMGFDRVNSARALRLPPAVTLAYLPFAPHVAAQVRRARLKGHPVMLHLPMEAPDHGGKPGINVLSVASEPEELRRQLTDILGRFGGYTGVNNHMGSKFTRDRQRMDIVVSELKKRGLFFLDSRTSGRSVGAAAAADAGIAHAIRDVFLDHEPDPQKIRDRIAETERIARRTGQAIAIGHPRKSTMNEVAPWLAGLKARGFDLVRLDSLLKRPERKKLAQLQTAE